MHPVTAPGRPAYRWAWAACGVVAAAALAIPGARLIALTGVPGDTSVFAHPQHVTISTATIPQAVTSVAVRNFGGQVTVTAGPVSQVRVTETLRYEDTRPAVAQSVAGGRLTLADPACQNTNCDVDFSVTVPSSVSVTVATQGGPAIVAGVAHADVTSDGGSVSVSDIGGPLTVSTGGGDLTINGVAGSLHAETDGGALIAHGIAAATASADTGGGPAQLSFAAAPQSVTVGSEGGPAIIRVPGGPYALSADSAGGPEIIGIATDPSASRSLKITSGGGPLQVQPAG